MFCRTYLAGFFLYFCRTHLAADTSVYAGKSSRNRLYKRCKTKVHSAAVESDSFKVGLGLYQGFAFSPYMFIILMDVLTEGVRKDVPDSMMFAGDIVVCGGK